MRNSFLFYQKVIANKNKDAILMSSLTFFSMICLSIFPLLSTCVMSFETTSKRVSTIFLFSSSCITLSLEFWSLIWSW